MCGGSSMSVFDTRPDRSTSLPCVFRGGLEIFGEREEESLSRSKSWHGRDKWVSQHLFSLVTWYFIKTVSNLIRKRWETSHGKADLCIFFPGLIRKGLADIKSYEFCFPQSVDALPVAAVLPPSHHRTAVGPNYRTTTSISRWRPPQKSGLHIYQQLLSCFLCTEKCWPLFQEANTTTSVTLVTSLSNCICKHPPVWVAERLCFTRSYPSKSSIATCTDFFFLFFSAGKM